MKVALIGGTGNIGEGLAFRLKLAGYDIIIGSRSEEKARSKAEHFNSLVESLGGKGNIEGRLNDEAAELADVAVITIPWQHAFETAERLKSKLKGKIVISPIVPMVVENGIFKYAPPEEGSAGLKLQRILAESSVVVAFNNIPAKRFANPAEKFEWDVAVCSDDDDAKRVVMEIVSSIKGLRAFDAGSLDSSRVIEALTPMLITLAKKNKTVELGVRFV
ncbi:NADPH-dependent F420 reductase [Geoglobus acetivorans]|uniref:NADPH-dependent F420 reductase n=1 Tax=Geoglobus acetivorans TaxID=565033 RepID=A0A0A7GGB4_GEOAI|nr:NADPH-dependent F420 reductase [Geoglobus acetivorans]